MEVNLQTEYWGRVSYREAWERQTALFDEIISARANRLPYVNRLVFCEHPHVYTLGKHGKEANMLLSEAQLKQIGAELFHIDRGGDITYHGRVERVYQPVGRSRNPGMPFVWHRIWKGEGGNRCMACIGYSRRAEDLCHRGTEQPFRNDARAGSECEHRFALFRLYPSVRLY